jgi:hypothetical protein
MHIEAESGALSLTTEAELSAFTLFRLWLQGLDSE